MRIIGASNIAKHLTFLEKVFKNTNKASKLLYNKKIFQTIKKILSLFQTIRLKTFKIYAQSSYV